MRLTRTTGVIAATLTLTGLLAATPVLADTALLGITDQGDVYQLDLTSGTSSLVGASGFTSVEGMAACPSGELYGITVGGTVFLIDAASGQGTFVTTVPVEGVGYHALACSDAGIFYALDRAGATTDLVTLDLAAGSRSLVGVVDAGGVLAEQITSLEFTPDATLYTYQARTDAVAGLWTLDPATAVVTDVNPALGAEDNIFALASASDGTLYGVFANTVYRVDRTTGALTAIGDFGSGVHPRGLAVVDPNLPPVNSVPGEQFSVLGLFPVTFSQANGNAISTSDPDAGSADVEVTLEAQNGRLTLGGTAGLTFSQGDGANDTTMTFRGTLAVVNAALDGLRYAPTLLPFLLSGGGSVTITTDDLGNTGVGGPLADTDTVAIERHP